MTKITTTATASLPRVFSRDSHLDLQDKPQQGALIRTFSRGAGLDFETQAEPVGPSTPLGKDGGHLLPSASKRGAGLAKPAAKPTPQLHKAHASVPAYK